MNDPYSHATSELTRGGSDSSGAESTKLYKFSGEIRYADLVDAPLAAGVPVVLLIVAIVFGGLIGVAGFASLGRGDRLAAALLLSSALAMLLAVIWFALRGSRRRAARQHLKSLPQRLGPIEGFVSSAWFQIKTPHTEMLSPLNAVTACRTNAVSLVFSTHVTGQYPQVLPSHLFEYGEFRSVCRLLTEAASQSQVRQSLFDERRTDLSRCIEIAIPAESLRFEGVLCLGDMRGSPLKGAFRLAAAKLLLIPLVVFAFFAALFVMLYLRDPGGIAQWIIVVVGLWLSYRVLKQLPALLGWGVDPQEPVMALRGFVDQDGLVVTTPLATSVSHWSAFASASFSNDAIYLRFPGSANMLVILPRRLFAEQDWDAFCDTIRRNLPCDAV